MTTRMIALDKLDPNPYRDLKLNPLNDEKIESLRESIDSTGFWDNGVQIRQVTIGKTITYQVVFGHHRVKAAKLQLGKKAKVSLTIVEIDDQQMLMRMARENNQVYNTSPAYDIESVTAALRGYVDGKIELPKANGQGKNIKPETYGVTSNKSHSVTNLKTSRKGLENILGLHKNRVSEALAAMEVISDDDNDVTEKDYQGKTHTEAKEINRDNRKSSKKKKAKKKKAKKELPDVNDLCLELRKEIVAIFNSGKLKTKLKEVAKHREYVDAEVYEGIITSLESLKKDVGTMIKRFKNNHNTVEE